MNGAPKTAEQINAPQTGAVKVEPKSFPGIPLAKRVADSSGRRKQPEAPPVEKPIVRTGRVAADHPGHRGPVTDVLAELAKDTAIADHWKAALSEEVKSLNAQAVEVSFHPHRKLLKKGDAVETTESFGSWHVKKIF